MPNPTDSKPDPQKARRARLAQTYTHLQTILEADENLLGFTQGHIAGGWRGKLLLGPETFFSPDVNIGLTDKRILLQHIHLDKGKLSSIPPHSFTLEEVLNMQYAEEETFNSEVGVGRLALHLSNEQRCRLRIEGAETCHAASELVEVFHSLTAARRTRPSSPTQFICGKCLHILDKPAKFCPYCGDKMPEEEKATVTETTATAEEASTAPMPAPDPDTLTSWADYAAQAQDEPQTNPEGEN